MLIKKNISVISLSMPKHPSFLSMPIETYIAHQNKILSKLPKPAQIFFEKSYNLEIFYMFL
jgi:hypothetical protein